jgi:hypothetical protein
MPPSRSARRRASPKPAATTAERLLETNDATLLDVVDSVLSKGVVLRGDLTLALANVDLVYAQFSLLLCAADRVFPTDAAPRRRRRR